jgi:DNA (cytosine-5)-methyltransferase 1
MIHPTIRDYVDLATGNSTGNIVIFKEVQNASKTTESRIVVFWHLTGGLDLGLQRAGMEIAWHSEIDPFCCEVLAHHWPGTPNLGDITKINWAGVEPVDVLCGGFPCQPHSVAGKRKGMNDERWLWPYFRDAIRVLRPRYAIIENVPGLLTVDGGRAFNRVLSDLAALGYDAEWQMLSAASFCAPHLRERIYIITYPHQERRGAGVYHNREHPMVHPQEWDAAQTLLGRGWEEGIQRWFKSLMVSDDRNLSASSYPRDDDGFPRWVAELAACGNAVVPQVAEYVGRCVILHANGK